MLISKAQDAQLNAVPDLDGVRHGAAIITKGDKFTPAVTLKVALKVYVQVLSVQLLLKLVVMGKQNLLVL